MSEPQHQIVDAPVAGAVVEFMLGNKEQIAIVLEESGGKVRLYTRAGREMKLTVQRILPWIGPVHPELDRAGKDRILAEHDERRSSLAESLDPTELWAMVQGEEERISAPFLAELLWPDPDADHIAAMGRMLLATKTHFKFQPPQFEVLGGEAVEKKLAEMERQKRRARIVEAGLPFFRALWNGVPAEKAAADLDEETKATLAEVLRKLIATCDDPDADALARQLFKGFPDNPHLALILAQRWGVVAQHHNYPADQADYDMTEAWTRPHAAEIERQRGAVAEAARAPVRADYISIDAPTTRDIDDAFVLDAAGEDRHTLSIALACPPLAYAFATPLDADVFDRATSVYIPEGTAYMLPETLATDLYSLDAGAPRPALVVRVELDGAGNVLSRDLAVEWIEVAENIAYETAEERITAEPDSALATMHRLAEALRQRRVERGAVVVDRPEPIIRLEGEGAETTVEITQRVETPASQLVVSELMILANESAALWAVERSLPLLFRTQEQALPEEAAGVWTDPVSIQQMVKHFGPTILEAEPRPHRGLGLSAYAPITSPLRRYVDLVNVGQLHHVLTTGEPRFTADQLSSMLARLSSRLEAVGQVQRYRPRYWKLEYIRQHKGEPFEALVVDDAGPFPTLAMPDMQLYVRAPRDMLGGKLRPGQRFAIRFGKVDPLMNESRVSGAEELEGGYED